MYVNLALNQVVLVDFHVIMNTSHGIRMSRRDNRVLLLKQSGTVGPRERGGEEWSGGSGCPRRFLLVVCRGVVVQEDFYLRNYDVGSCASNCAIMPSNINQRRHHQTITDQSTIAIWTTLMEPM